MKPLLYVDGYNVIGAWPQAQRENWPLDVCRDRLIHLLEDYAGYSGQEVWLVFDGYRTDRTLRTVDERDGLTVVYTRHGETARGDHHFFRRDRHAVQFEGETFIIPHHAQDFAP